MMPADRLKTFINFTTIPTCLRQLPNWALYTYNKAPIKLSAVARGWPVQGWNDALTGPAAIAGAKSNDPTTWGLFDDCRTIYQRFVLESNGPASTIIQGPTVALTLEANITVIDLDNPERALETKRSTLTGLPFTDEERAPLLEAAYASQAEVLELFKGHYVERSASGTGWHIFVPGHLPQGHRFKFGYHGSVFSVGQFINMTGNTSDLGMWKYKGLTGPVQPGEFHEDQLALNRFYDTYSHSDYGLLIPTNRENDPKSFEEGETLGLDYEKYGRRGDLTDAEVLTKLSKGMRSCYDGFALTADHSGDCISLLGDLEKISSSPDQIRRLLWNSPRMLGAGIDNSGHSRWEKFFNYFDGNIAKVRRSNDAKFADWESKGTLIDKPRWREMQEAFGRFLSEDHPGSMAYKAAQAERALREQESEARRLYDTHVEQLKVDQVKYKRKGFKYTKYSQDAIALLSCGIHENYIDGSLEVPPGRMGELCNYAYEGMRAPFMKFAVPATFAAMAGVMARKYKTPVDGDGLNLMFVTLGQTGVGKTQSIESWGSFMADLAREVRFKRRYIHLPAGSRQGMQKELESTPCMTWVVDECATQLQQIIAPRLGDTNAELLQGFANQIFDIGRHDREYRPLASVRSQKDEDKAIANLCVSTFWGTTQSNARTFFTKEAVKSGIVARIIFINHSTSGGIARDFGEQRLMALPQGDAREVVKYLLVAADELDGLYSTALGDYDPASNIAYDVWAKAQQEAMMGVRSKIVEVKLDDQALQLAKVMFKQSDIFMRGIHDDVAHSLFPDYYLALNRLGPIALRIAALMSVTDHPHTPVIGYHHLAWALGYVLQASCSVLSALDTNDLGVDFDDAEMTVVKIMNAMMIEPEWAGKGYVAYGDLIRRLVRNAPFHNHTRGARNEAKKCLDDMVEHEQINMIDYTPKDAQGNVIRAPGPKKRHLTPNEHPIWRM